MNDRAAHPLDRLEEFEADCASGAWDEQHGNYWAWVAVCYPLARQMMHCAGALKAEHFAPEMKRSIPANKSKAQRDNARDDHGWDAIIAKVNAARGRR